MERYDYTDLENAGLVFAELDSLSRSQLKAVDNAITEIKKRGENESLSQFGRWFDAALLPVFKNFAETTCSLLEINRSPTNITVLLRNSRGVDISDECRSIKTAFCMAGHVYVQKEGDDMVLGMVYNWEQFKG